MMRYEVLLPLEFNDGKSIPRELLQETADEVRQRFGAVSLENITIEGAWTDDNGDVSVDEMCRFFVDVDQNHEPSPEVGIWFRAHKEIWKKRFQQEEIWIVHYYVEKV